jgi:broad specificity phosphatase PhoE
VAERLAHAPFEVLISSPFPRAHQTAQAIAGKTGHKIVLSDLFVERGKPSALAGKPYTDEAANKLYHDYIQTMYDPGGRISDAENYNDIVTRADKALAYLLARPETTLAVVTHGWFLRVIIARMLLGDQLTGAMLKRFEELIAISNTGITVLNYQDAYEEDFTWRLWTMNDRSHFAE